MILHIAIGKEMCFYLWEQNYAKMIELSSEEQGDIFTIDTEKIDSTSITLLLTAVQSQGKWEFVSQEEMEIIKKLENNI